MRDNLSSQLEHRGNLGHQRVKMKFSTDAAAQTHLMSILTDLYSDPIGTTIREVSVNGRDAQIEAGYNGPLEVTAPTEMMPYFLVMDHGTGMTADFIENEYSEYGTSTKRDTDDQTGFLGIGGKSPLTLTKQFTLSSVRDGVKTIALVNRGEDGGGGVEVVDTERTDEPNGTMVKIPVDELLRFRKKIYEFFKWWPAGSVLIDGNPNETVKPVLELDPDVKVYTNVNNDIVLMGDVAYPVSREFSISPWGHSPYKVAIRVPMGAVNFTPSREELQYTPLTKETLELAAMWVRDHWTRRLCEMIEEQETFLDAWNFLNGSSTIARMIPKESAGDLTWRGKKVPTDHYIKAPKSMWDAEEKVRSWTFSPNHTRGDASIIKQLSLFWLTNMQQQKRLHMIEGYPNKTFSKRNQEKITKWASKHGKMRCLFIVTPAVGELSWLFDGARTNWSEIAKYVVEVEQPKPSYSVFSTKEVKDHLRNSNQKNWERGNSLIYASSISKDELPDRGRVIYYSPAVDLDQHGMGRTQAGPVLALMFPDAHVVPLAQHRVKKLCRQYTRAKHAKVVIKEELEKLRKGTDPLQQFMLMRGNDLHSNGFGALAAVADQILDPDLAKMIGYLQHGVGVELERKYNSLVRLRRWFQTYPSSTIFLEKGYKQELMELYRRYPLLTGTTARTGEALDYVNSLYLYKHAEEADG